MSEASTDRGEPGTARVTARQAAARLLPVAAMAAVVGLMIRGGIARQQERVRATTRPTIRSFAADAARFLANAQRADGSWDYYRSRSPDFAVAEAHARAASTMRILLAVKGTPHAERPFYAAGLAFARAHRRRLPPARGAPAPVARGDEGTEATVEVVSLALLLEPEAGAAEDLRALLRGQRTPRGLYRSALARPNDAPVLLADNVLALGALPALGIDVAPVAAGVRSWHEGGGAEPSPSWTVLRYLAALAYEWATPAGRSHLAPLLAGSTAPVATASDLDSLTLAAHMKVRADHCLRQRQPCTDLNAAAGALVRRRQGDGSWPAAPFAQDGSYFLGSSAETTSFALKALDAFARLREGSADRTPAAGDPSEGRRTPAASPEPSRRK